MSLAQIGGDRDTGNMTRCGQSDDGPSTAINCHWPVLCCCQAGVFPCLGSGTTSPTHATGQDHQGPVRAAGATDSQVGAAAVAMFANDASPDPIL